MAELINDKYRCDFQSSEILTLSLLIQDYYTYYAMVVNGEEKLYVKNLFHHLH